MILDFYILDLGLSEAAESLGKCSFAEFELTFQIGNHFVQITFGQPPHALN
jgi:hypothetical protein